MDVESGSKMITTIVSGGQTGVDRAALDAALDSGLGVSGWCPKGRLAEDGCIDPRYELRETPGTNYADRTERNVRESDATLILYRRTFSGGSSLTALRAREHARPLLTIDVLTQAESIAVEWVVTHRISTLNVAGPRESEDPGMYRAAREWLDRFLQLVGGVSTLAHS